MEERCQLIRIVENNGHTPAAVFSDIAGAILKIMTQAGLPDSYWAGT
ncbi:MAG TPA: hypothetical protein VMT32_07925 [Bryobacteraceae bacterium]|nr:hypothetical protein [Bryobacteraceae bacterium]